MPDQGGLLDISLALPDTWRWPLVIRVRGLVATWSSTLDESVAGQVPWPAAWPAAVSSFLQPSPLIASDHEAIQKAVQATVGIDPRAAARPLAVAKRLIQAACASFQLNGSHLLHGPVQTMRGINATGAVIALARGGGSRADLVCLCTAVLRSAGIPARPVLCIGNPKSDRKGEFDIRAEFFIPEAGWVPYDPDALRRRDVGKRSLDEAWRDLGNSPDLNRNVALCWSFAPDQGRNAYEAWAGWTWARLAVDEPFPLEMRTGAFRYGDNELITGSANLHSQINLHISSKGRPEALPPSPWRGSP
jgi:transglutaminase-like putative cysteine protease